MYESAHYLVCSSRLKQTDTVAHCPGTKVFEKATHSLKGATNEWTVYGRRHTFFPPAVADRGKKAPKADTALFLNHNKHDANQYKYTQRECRFSIARELKKKTKASLDLTRTNVKSLSQQSAAVALFVTLSAICRIHTHTNNNIMITALDNAVIMY